jgi:putative membrane protein
VKDYNAGDIVDLTFTSVSSGTPTALLSGVVDILKDNTTLESTQGVTLTSTFRNVVGHNHVRIQTTADSTFYSVGSKFMAILSAGTVDGNSAAGYGLGTFSLRLGTIDEIADGTTTLSTDLDDVIAESTLISAESTATAAVADGIAAGTTSLAAEATAHTTQLQALTSASSRLEASTTAIMAGTTTLSTDLDDLIATSTLIAAESTATAAVVDGIASGTTMVSTDLDDLIASTTAIEANLPDTLSLTAINAEVDTALVDAGVVHQVTTISSLTSQTVFDLAAGSTSDSAYVGDMVIVTDASNATDKAVGLVSAYSGAGKTITLKADPGIFAMSTNDLIAVVPVTRALPAGLADGAAGLPVSDAGGLDLDGLTSETSGIAAGTTTLSTDLDDLITTTTAIHAESTASAAVIDLIGAETSALTTSLEQLTSSSSRLEVEATAHTTQLQLLTSATTTLSTDIDDLLTEATAHTTQLQLLTSATTTLSTDIDDLITTTTAILTAILDDTGVSGVLLSTAGADTVWTVAIAELSTAMPATPAVLDILAFQHMAAWNQRVTTATSGWDIIYNDAGSTAFIARVTKPTTASFQRGQWSTST